MATLFGSGVSFDMTAPKPEIGGFPEAKVKQRVRDRIDPDRDLGHNDRNQ